MPYARLYNPRLVYFKPAFWRTEHFFCFLAVFLKNSVPMYLSSREGYDGACNVYGTFFLHVWISGSIKFNIRVCLLSVLYPIKVKLDRLDFSAIKDFKEKKLRTSYKKKFHKCNAHKLQTIKNKKVVKDENFWYRAVKYFLYGCLRIYKSLCFMVCFLPAKDTKDKVNPS
jgi:hypothetical protein